MRQRAIPLQGLWGLWRASTERTLQRSPTPADFAGISGTGQPTAAGLWRVAQNGAGLARTNGFITDKDVYLEQRVKLQQELEQLTPIPDDELETAADVLENFEYHWNATNGEPQLQQNLLQLIVARVWVRGDRVVAMSLRPNYHVTVGLESKKPTELRVDFSECNIVRNRGRWGSLPAVYKIHLIPPLKIWWQTPPTD